MEKEFKGTKGKWEYHIIGFNASAYHCIKSKDGKTICLIYLKEHLSSEVECNAQLIATAPELLKFAMYIAKHEKGSAPSVGYFQEMIERAEKVINKALG